METVAVSMSGGKARPDPGRVFPSLQMLEYRETDEDEDIAGSFHRIKAALGAGNLLETR